MSVETIKFSMCAVSSCFGACARCLGTSGLQKQEVQRCDCTVLCPENRVVSVSVLARVERLCLLLDTRQTLFKIVWCQNHDIKVF